MRNPRLRSALGSPPRRSHLAQPNAITPEQFPGESDLGLVVTNTKMGEGPCDLTQDLEKLCKLHEYRTRAKELRKQALPALKKIRRKGKSLTFKAGDDGIDSGRWVFGNDQIETALVVKVQSHRELSESEEENNKPRNTADTLKRALEKLDLRVLLPQPNDTTNRSTMPVLVAARGMQALVTQAEAVFKPATMYCYYRIIRELYGVAQPNWTVGAARAGLGGTTSAFVTNECIRAIFAFKNALERTCKFFDEILDFHEYFSSLKNIVGKWDIKSGPLYEWVNQSIEVRWLDCQIATNPRNREMALFWGGQGRKNALLLPDLSAKNRSACIEAAQSYFDELPEKLGKAVEKLFQSIAEVYYEIARHREVETPGLTCPIRRRPDGTYEFDPGYEFNPEKRTMREAGTEEDRKKEQEEKKRDRESEEKISIFNRTETAHLFALRTLEHALVNAGDLRRILVDGEVAIGENKRNKSDRTKQILEEIAKKFYTITRSVDHVLDPSKQYLKWVLNRELAAPPATFDAGELVFAATSYGAIIDWRMDDRLTRACELLINSLPENGRLPTKRAFHADPRGYRIIPIGCEMTRALANLLQKTGYDFDAKFVARMLGIFEEQLIELHESTAKTKLIGWNFEGAPNPGKTAVWVTAVSVLALDRIVRMLNTRINEIVLAHFDVTMPKRPHTRLTLRDLIYSDHGLAKSFRKEEGLAAIHLQKARAHVMRATLPKQYRKSGKSFSMIYYGPPRTGKTTLAESLALSAEVPLLRLSPGDLILQGQEMIEARAHDIFEALSMLTQCVIIFDEFEPVLKNRGNETKSSSSRDRLGRIGDLLQNISEKDDPKFRFVLGGMLPKLIKLHDSAERQSFAYCLGTNCLSDIDTAAKRPGRFDQKIPVYKPDPLSRAGALLYGLSQSKRVQEKNPPELQRFYEVIARTIGEPADRISKLFTIENGKQDLTATLKYILGNPKRLEDLKKSKTNLETLKAETPTDTDTSLDKEEHEKEQREWIHGYEKCFLDEEKHFGDEKGEQTWDTVFARLNERLKPPKGRSHKEGRSGS